MSKLRITSSALGSIKMKKKRKVLKVLVVEAWLRNEEHVDIRKARV